MSAQTIERTETDLIEAESDAPHIAHAWCTCWERDGLESVSLCGQRRGKRMADLELDWPEDMQNCALCEALSVDPCPRCLGGGAA